MAHYVISQVIPKKSRTSLLLLTSRFLVKIFLYYSPLKSAANQNTLQVVVEWIPHVYSSWHTSNTLCSRNLLVMFPRKIIVGLYATRLCSGFHLGPCINFQSFLSLKFAKYRRMLVIEWTRICYSSWHTSNKFFL